MLEEYEKYDATNIAKIFKKFIIPTSVDGLDIPTNLVGRSMQFTQFITEEHFKPLPKNPTEYERHNIKHYSLDDIQTMFAEVGKFHSFFENKKELIRDIEPFFQLVVEDYETLSRRLLNIGIDIEKSSFDEFYNNIHEKIQQMTTELNLSGSMEQIKTEYSNHLKKAYGHRLHKFTTDKLDQSIHSNLNILDNNDKKFGRKLVYMESLHNILNRKHEFIEILKHLNLLREKISFIMNLPETITHNDIHPLNFIKSDDGKTYIIDMERVGKNKRLCDIGFTLIKNKPDEEVQKHILSGYTSTNLLTEREMSYLYDFYELRDITSFVREIVRISSVDTTELKHIIDPGKTLGEVEELSSLSANNPLPRIFSLLFYRQEKQVEEDRP